MSLTRVSSASGRSEESIKSITQRFDLGIVFRLSLASKGLTAITCLVQCTNMTDLDLSDNIINKIEGLETLVFLRRLNLSCNRIKQVEGLSTLQRLETLKLQGNLLTLSGLNLPELTSNKALKALYCQSLDRTQPCPACAEKAYRSTVLTVLPGLSNLDGERFPHTVNYAVIAEEVRMYRLNPPPPPEVVIPEVEPWLPTSSGASEGQGFVVDPEFEKRAGQLTRGLDDCHALAEVLRGEVDKCQQLLQAQAAAQ